MLMHPHLPRNVGIFKRKCNTNESLNGGISGKVINLKKILIQLVLGKFCCFNPQMQAFQKSPGSVSKFVIKPHHPHPLHPCSSLKTSGKPCIFHCSQFFFSIFFHPHRDCSDSKWVLGMHSNEMRSKRSWSNTCLYMQDICTIWVFITQGLSTCWNKFGLTPLLQINAFYLASITS